MSLLSYFGSREEIDRFETRTQGAVVATFAAALMATWSEMFHGSGPGAILLVAGFQLVLLALFRRRRRREGV